MSSRTFMSKMFWRIFSFDYTEQIEFRSNFSLKDSVKRLKDATTKPTFMILLAADVPESSLLGQVSEDSVILRRVIPLFGNSHKPIFYGKFVREADKIILRGIFTIGNFARIMNFVAYTILSLFAVIITFIAVTDANQRSQVLLELLLLACLVYGVGAISRIFSNRDVLWISQKIRVALGSNEVE